jgi:hypothetical protein
MITGGHAEATTRAMVNPTSEGIRGTERSDEWMNELKTHGKDQTRSRKPEEPLHPCMIALPGSLYVFNGLSTTSISLARTVRQHHDSSRPRILRLHSKIHNPFYTPNICYYNKHSKHSNISRYYSHPTRHFAFLSYCVVPYELLP